MKAAVLLAVLVAEAAFAGGPVDLSGYAMPAGAQPAATPFDGRLKFTVRPEDAHGEIVLDRWNVATPGREWLRPPAFDFGFVSVEGHLVPVERGIVAGDGDWWDWIVGPGRTWQDGASGWSRASVPVALIEKNANCIHNGVLGFRYRGESEVSRVAYQFSHETCHYFQFEAWGTADAVRSDDPGIDRAAVGAAYRIELSRRLPVRPVAQLPKDYPGVDPRQFGSQAEVEPGDMTLFGVLVRGIHYAGGCDTRRGPYPYCDEMPLPSYSVAKTAIAAFALMRAEALHPGVRQLAVADYVPACRDAGGWEVVTFEHLLDMASGRYDSPGDQVDEDVANASRFFLATTHAEKIGIACSRYPRKEPPGRRWVYHTTDTYILGAALASWWRGLRGGDADFYRDLLLDPVYRRLGLSPELSTPRRTVDDAAQPFTGWGLVLRRDDLVKLGGFLALGEGRLGADTLLDGSMLKAALQRDPSARGLPAPGNGFRYDNGVWAWDAAAYLGCEDAAWVPFMSGFGGISVVMVPNGIVYYYVSDGGAFRWARAVAESARFGAICRGRVSDDG